jgi:hypothetical protein
LIKLDQVIHSWQAWLNKIGHWHTWLKIVIVIYVDDLIVMGDNDVYIFDLKKFWKHKFEMKDLGKFCHFFSIEMINSPKKIWLLQKKYALNML